MALLEKGSRVGLVATANPVIPQLNESLNYAMSFFERMGLDPIIGKHALDQPKDGAILVDAKTRAEDVNRLAADPSVKAIINLWGGYDSADLLPYLDWDNLRNKLLIGASDFTTLLNAGVEKNAIPTYLWANAIWLGLEVYRKSEDTFQRFFMNNIDVQDNDLFLLAKPKVLKEGKGEGTLVGGNLQTFEKLIGTHYFPKVKKPILILEDVEGDIAHVLSSIKKLIDTSFFKDSQGIIIGNFSHEGKELGQELHREIIKLFKDYTFPIIFTPYIGHNIANEVLPIGGMVLLDTVNSKYDLLIEDKR